MIGIIGSMQVEVDALTNSIKDREEKVISGIIYNSGTIEGKKVVVAKCGIGKVFAGICTQTMILNYPVECIINIGVAGSLSEKLEITDIAIASAMVQHDMDTSAVGDPLGLVSGPNIIEIPCDSILVDKMKISLNNLSMNGLVGIIATGDQFVHKTETKEFIINEFGAIACEMEGAAIALVSYINNVPCTVLRAISDSANGSAQMDYPIFMEKAAKRSYMLMIDFIKNF